MPSQTQEHYKGSSIQYVHKIFRKTNILAPW